MARSKNPEWQFDKDVRETRDQTCQACAGKGIVHGSTRHNEAGSNVYKCYECNGTGFIPQTSQPDPPASDETEPVELIEIQAHHEDGQMIIDKVVSRSADSTALKPSYKEADPKANVADQIDPFVYKWGEDASDEVEQVITLAMLPETSLQFERKNKAVSAIHSLLAREVSTAEKGGIALGAREATKSMMDLVGPYLSPNEMDEVMVKLNEEAQK